MLLLVGLACITGTMIVMDRFYTPKAPPSSHYEELLSDMDSLSNCINSLSKEKDSLQLFIDTTKSRIDTVEYWYEKELIDIVNQPIRSDVEFFTKYLSETNERFSNSINSDTIKTN